MPRIYLYIYFSGRLPPALAAGLPSTSFGVITPREVRPTPKIVGKRASARRIRVDTSVLTSTPYKKYLEEEAKKKTDIEEKTTCDICLSSNQFESVKKKLRL